MAREKGALPPCSALEIAHGSAHVIRGQDHVAEVAVDAHGEADELALLVELALHFAAVLRVALGEGVDVDLVEHGILHICTLGMRGID